MTLVSKAAEGLTIHGIQHILGVDRNRCSRIFWLVIFITSACGLSFYVANLYTRLSVSPDINVRVSSILSSQIPFPAITICTPVFAKNKLVDIEKFIKHKGTKMLNMTVEEQNYLSSNVHACHPQYGDLIANYTMNRTNIDIVQYLNSSFLPVSGLFHYCAYKSMPQNCEKIFSRVLTDRGYCYAFNQLGFNTIFKNSSISSDFLSYKKINMSKFMRISDEDLDEMINDESESVEWNLSKGYNKTHSAPYSIPVKAQKRVGLLVYPLLREVDASNLCATQGKVFSFYLHLPNEIFVPFSHREQYVEFGRRKDIILSAKSYKTEKAMQRYSPEVRGCYFEGEKELKFFKTYTKSLCEYECMTNYTFKICGCVKFSMPRNSITPVCGLEKAKCYFTAMESWPVYESLEDKFSATCGCLKSCTYIEYEIKFEKNVVIDNSDISRGGAISGILLGFDAFEIQEYEEYAAYNVYNFIADTGGLLGLFVGGSLISLIELVYFAIKIIAHKIKDKCKVADFKSKNKVTYLATIKEKSKGDKFPKFHGNKKDVSLVVPVKQ